MSVNSDNFCYTIVTFFFLTKDEQKVEHKTIFFYNTGIYITLSRCVSADAQSSRNLCKFSTASAYMSKASSLSFFSI